MCKPLPARSAFSALGRVFPRGFFPCTRAAYDFCARAGISARFLSLYPRGLRFLRADGFFRAVSFPVPARHTFSARGRVFPRGFFLCTRAAYDFCARAGIFAGILLLYPRGRVFPRGFLTFGAILIDSVRIGFSFYIKYHTNFPK